MTAPPEPPWLQVGEVHGFGGMSTIQIGRDGLATPSWLMLFANAPAADPVPRGAGYAQVTLQIVTATFGIVLWPRVVDDYHHARVLGQALRAGNLATAWTGKLPLGLVGVLSLTAAARAQRRTCRKRDRKPQAVLRLLLLKARRTYHLRSARTTVQTWWSRTVWRRLTSVASPPRRRATGRTSEDLIRAVADRTFLPTKNVLDQVGNMMILTGKTLTSAVRPPYPYGSEFVGQFLFAMKLCWFPLLVSTVAFGYGAPGLQAANFLVLFGALDRLGGFFVLASIREFAPFVDAIVLAGVAGTAITADLGARKIREELDALQVLGVDPIKNLVVPRFLALMLVTGLFDIYALLFGIFGGIIATLVNNAPLGPFWATFFNNASTTDLWGSVVKTTIFGAIIAIVCCYKGMTASGGAEGVGRAVNQAVVIAFLGIFAFNYAFTQTLLATHPEITTIVK